MLLLNYHYPHLKDGKTETRDMNKNLVQNTQVENGRAAMHTQAVRLLNSVWFVCVSEVRITSKSPQTFLLPISPDELVKGLFRIRKRLCRRHHLEPQDACSKI